MPKIVLLLLSVLSSALTLLALPSSALADDTGLRILAFGDSNTWGWKPVETGFPTTRYTDQQRWPGVAQTALGDNHVVVVDGLVGRTSNLDAAQSVGAVSGANFNGSRSITISVASHSPLDWVVIMLGTNDLQAEHQRKPGEIAKAVFRMAEQIRNMSNPLYSTYAAPRVLVVAPPALGDTSRTPLSGLFSVAEQPSKQLSAAFSQQAKQQNTQHPGIHFLDAQGIIGSDGIDGVHLSQQSHQALGIAIANFISKH